MARNFVFEKKKISFTLLTRNFFFQFIFFVFFKRFFSLSLSRKNKDGRKTIAVKRTDDFLLTRTKPRPIRT